jgi:hypothetical protein
MKKVLIRRKKRTNLGRMQRTWRTSTENNHHHSRVMTLSHALEPGGTSPGSGRREEGRAPGDGGGGDWNEGGVPSSTGGDGEDLQLARDAQPKFRKSTSVPVYVLCFDNDQIAIICNNKLEIAFNNILFAGSMSWWWIHSLSLSLSCWILLWKRIASRILCYARNLLAVLCVRLSNREAASYLCLFLWSFTLFCELSVPI